MKPNYKTAVAVLAVAALGASCGAGSSRSGNVSAGWYYSRIVGISLVCRKAKPAEGPHVVRSRGPAPHRGAIKYLLSDTRPHSSASRSRTALFSRQ
jgi:hypothetical protein